jgi:CBS domain-containing protein
MQHTARDVMTTHLITLSPKTTAEEAIRTLLANKISGAPVLDEAGDLAGIVSEFQLLAVIYNESFRNRPIGELMTRDVLTVDEHAPLTEVASKFIRHRIRRLPVVRCGKVVGQISRRDVIRYAVERPDRFDRFVAMFNGELPIDAEAAIVL